MRLLLLLPLLPLATPLAAQSCPPFPRHGFTGAGPQDWLWQEELRSPDGARIIGITDGQLASEHAKV